VKIKYSALPAWLEINPSEILGIIKATGFTRQKEFKVFYYCHACDVWIENRPFKQEDVEGNVIHEKYYCSSCERYISGTKYRRSSW